MTPLHKYDFTFVLAVSPLDEYITELKKKVNFLLNQRYLDFIIFRGTLYNENGYILPKLLLLLLENFSHQR